MQRTLRERMQAALLGRKVPYVMWPEAIEFAATMLNLTPTTDGVPFANFFARDPQILSRFLKPFGCLASVFVPEDKRVGGKSGPRAVPAMFIGLDIEHRGWKFYSPQSNPSTFWANSARFHEDKTWADRKSMANWADLLDHPHLFSDAESEIADLRYSRFDLLCEQDVEARDHLESGLAFSTTATLVAEHGSCGPEIEFDIDIPAPAALVASIATNPTVKQALAGPQAAEWQKAIDAEMRGLADMGTFTVVDIPKGIRPIGSKLILKLILDDNNLPARFKARLVALGNLQRPERDFGEVFAPVAPYTAVRTILALAVANGWSLHATDFTQAYLNGSIDRDLYLLPPPSAGLPPGTCYRVDGNLYGLRQAGRIWNQHLDALLRKLGFSPCPSAPCAYTKGNGQTYCVAVVYVDDMLIASPSRQVVDDTKKAMADKYRLTDKGQVTQFCGIHLDYDQAKRTLLLHQHPFLNKLLDEFLPDDARPCRSPMDVCPPPTTLELKESDRKKYQGLVGKLIWLSNNSRWDIAFATGVLARHMSRPGQQHLDAAVRVLRYLKGSVGTVMKFCPDLTRPLTAYTDANWASDPHVGRRSTSGALVLAYGCPVSWKSQIQKCVALSAVEAEMVAGCEATRELLFVKHVLQQLGVGIGSPTLFTDSLGCVQVAKNPSQHFRLKHIDIKYHFLRQQVQANEMVVEHVRTNCNPADVFTKPVGKHVLLFHRRSFGLVD